MVDGIAEDYCYGYGRELISEGHFYIKMQDLMYDGQAKEKPEKQISDTTLLPLYSCIYVHFLYIFQYLRLSFLYK